MVSHHLDVRGFRFASSSKEPNIETKDVQLLLMVANAGLAKPVQVLQCCSGGVTTHLESFYIILDYCSI